MTIQLADLVFEPFIDAAAIRARVAEIGAEISADYAGQVPVLIGVLNGSFMFLSDLAKQISITCEIEFIRLASYAGTQSSGDVREVIGLREELAGRDVIIVEDIVDSGLTLKNLIEKSGVKTARSVRICSLLVKPRSMQHQFTELRYTGFEIAPDFVVGYGLDYNGLGRNLPEIYRLKNE